MMCDIILAADTAKFGQPEIKLGIIPGMGGTQRLTALVGPAKAMDLILTGRIMDAAEAERAGLAARVIPAAGLMAEALRTAEAIASLSLPAVLMAKEAVGRAAESGGLPKACGSSGACSIRSSPRRTRRRVWRLSSRSGRRASRIAERARAAGLVASAGPPNRRGPDPPHRRAARRAPCRGSVRRCGPPPRPGSIRRHCGA